MRNGNRWLLMTTAAALCAAPVLAFGQANTGGSSMQTQTTQTTPQQGPTRGTPAARDAATTGTQATQGAASGSGSSAGADQQRTTQTERVQQNPANTTGTDARPGSASSTDGTPGNPPSTATQRAVDSVTGQRTDPDGTGNNPPGTAAGRALDRATDGTTTTTTTRTAPANQATGATTPGMAVDSARLQGGRRATKMIGANVYNESNDSIGEVDDIIVPQNGAGQPVAVLSVGGFLGIGARLVAVPYERLQWNAERERWMLPGATKDSLQSLPPYSYEDGNRRG
ncbi:hypothetical protein DFH01_03880 [Falsiroseomonas bella]|uniref:PRC-barrel domain-containing protein n=1 Tax=Falsiroseomonas bella TaxID=2184016 RepID=A0A317FIJ6_9PROT|nr:PRC-barrel domain-containing protein [Falsiroseomonas bella]PWS38433.1 hypothetical protein DFH01_03880 [Falsiroseomonas bella]